MININFDNPYLLLLIIPLFAVVTVPYFITVRKENKSRETVTALIIHLLIVVLFVLAAAGMSNVTVITETELYAVVDVSHSANERLDLVDGYLADLEDQLPRNSKMGVITFGKDAVLHTPVGEKLTSVKNSANDKSATDIASALAFAGEQFTDSTIKRIVLYTDGMSTDPDASGDLVRIVEDLSDKGIYIDVVYIDSNISPDVTEVQISSVEFIDSAFLNTETTADILIETSAATDVIVRLSKNGESYLEKPVKLTLGFNTVNFELDTSAEGVIDYEITLIPLNDNSSFNNKYSFSQRVSGQLRVLHITERQEDVEYVKALYSESSVIDSYVKPSQPTQYGQLPKPFYVPYTVEELCLYDEIILTNIDVSGINNADTFVKSLDTVVSVFGKSLFTAGNCNIHNSIEPSVISLGNMLPVKFGNSEEDPKLYTIVLDTSRSMEFGYAQAIRMAKVAACYLLDILGENDYFAVYHFSGDTYPLYAPTQALDANITDAKNAINQLEVTQGTMIGKALENVLNDIKLEPYSDKQVMLISDGLGYESGDVNTNDNTISAASDLKANGIILSTLHIGPEESYTLPNGSQQSNKTNMKEIAGAGGGKFYTALSPEDLDGILFGEIFDDITVTDIVKETDVIINRENDGVLTGISKLEPVGGYYFAKPKASAENILYVDHMRTSGSIVKVPLYSYWKYGSGRVATLTTDIGGDRISGWSGGSGESFLKNILTTNMPKSKIDYPYNVSIEFDGKNIHVEIIPATLYPDAEMTVTIKTPSGEIMEKKLIFDSYRYFYAFEASEVGKYEIVTSYAWQSKDPFTSTQIYSIPYSPEYDSFTFFDPAKIHSFVRNLGNVTEDGNAVLDLDETKLETYVLRFDVPLLAIAAILYLIDTIIRKLKWADIRSLFKIRKKGAKK